MLKIIHYCWLGGDTPSHVKQQVESWRTTCPDFDFYEWNDSNATLHEHPYFQQARKHKRWAFASDIVQLKKLYEHGGFYLDCDVRILKNLNTIPAPDDHLIMGYMYDCALSGGFMYSPAGHPLVAKMLEYYDDINPGFFAANNTILTDCINNNVDDFLLNGNFYSSNKYKLTIFPKEYFCHPSLVPGRSFIVDLFSGSWKTENQLFEISRQGIGFLRAIRRKFSCYRALLKNEFYPIYKAATKGNKILRTEYWRKKYGRTGGAISIQTMRTT